MYDELVKRLRQYNHWSDAAHAAQAISELQLRIHAMNAYILELRQQVARLEDVHKEVAKEEQNEPVQ